MELLCKLIDKAGPTMAARRSTKNTMSTQIKFHEHEELRDFSELLFDFSEVDDELLDELLLLELESDFLELSGSDFLQDCACA